MSLRSLLISQRWSTFILLVKGMITKTHKQGNVINCVSVGNWINKEKLQASDLAVIPATYTLQRMNLLHLLGSKQ